MLRCLARLPIAKVCIALLVLFLLSGCTFFDSADPSGPQSTVNLTPTPTPLGIAVPVCHLSSCTNLAPIPGVHPFPDTWQNIHLFQTFDFNVKDRAALAKHNDFIWGAAADYYNLSLYRRVNPNIMLSYYITLHRDDGTLTDTDLAKHRGPDYWINAGHRDWILYKCDRTTPAREYEDPNTPFVLNNPDVINWQIANYIQPANDYGYDAIAVDNVNMENMFGGCGYYDNSGQWVQRYTGQTVDPQWQADVLAWVTKMQAYLHSLAHPMALIANFSAGAVPLDAQASQDVLAHVDGVVDESSFTHYGEGYLAGDTWLQMVQYVNKMQRENKPFFLINEFQHDATQDDVQWVLASYLMCKQRLALVYISHIQGYGGDSYLPAYAMAIGSPSSEMYFSQGAYWRDYTGGEVLVNPSDTPATITLKPSTSYVDLANTPVTSPFTLPAHSDKILLNKTS